MKAQLHARPTPAISPVIKRVAILGGFALACVWLFLEFCATMVNIFE
jgi:hypothetical protein